VIDLPSNDPHAALSILASVSRFSTLSETRGMRDWLKSELMRLHQANQYELDNTIYRQRQGACQVLAKLFEIAETADEKADKIQANLHNKGARS
jgi:hypothetical protein